jgi:hypothetical protein
MKPVSSVSAPSLLATDRHPSHGDDAQESMLVALSLKSKARRLTRATESESDALRVPPSPATRASFDSQLLVRETQVSESLQPFRCYPSTVALRKTMRGPLIPEFVQVIQGAGRMVRRLGTGATGDFLREDEPCDSGHRTSRI